MALSIQAHADQFAALGSPVRLEVLRLLVQGHTEGTIVGDLQARLDIPWSTLSHHLERLSDAGLVIQRPQGKYIYYRANYEALRQLTDYLWQDCCKGGGCC